MLWGLLGGRSGASTPACPRPPTSSRGTAVALGPQRPEATSPLVCCPWTFLDLPGLSQLSSRRPWSLSSLVPRAASRLFFCFLLSVFSFQFSTSGSYDCDGWAGTTSPRLLLQAPESGSASRALTPRRASCPPVGPSSTRPTEAFGVRWICPLPPATGTPNADPRDESTADGSGTSVLSSWTGVRSRG